MRVRRQRPEVRSIAQSANVLHFGAIPARVTFVVTRLPNSGSGADALPDPGSMTAVGVRRDKAALSSWCKPHPTTAPAGSNRSRHGGDEMSEAFGSGSRIGDRASVQAATRVNAEQAAHGVVQ